MDVVTDFLVTITCGALCLCSWLIERLIKRLECAIYLAIITSSAIHEEDTGNKKEQRTPCWPWKIGS